MLYWLAYHAAPARFAVKLQTVSIAIYRKASKEDFIILVEIVQNCILTAR
jgi:hypothetical protein